MKTQCCIECGRVFKCSQKGYQVGQGVVLKEVCLLEQDTCVCPYCYVLRFPLNKILEDKGIKIPILKTCWNIKNIKKLYYLSKMV